MYNDGINISSTLFSFAAMDLHANVYLLRNINVQKKKHEGPWRNIMSLDLGLVADDGRAYNKSFRHRFIQTRMHSRAIP
jgi:hypothetical protein